MKKPAFLISVQRIIRRIQIQHDRLRRRRMRLEKDIDEQLIDLAVSQRRLLVAMILRGADRREFQPIERAFARQRFSTIGAIAPILAGRIPEIAGRAEASSELVKVLVEREDLHSTGMGDGVALPHARNAVGGLVSRQETQMLDKVPFLGDIPVAGHLFKSTQRLDNKAELLIFVTPTIVEDRPIL